MLDRTKLKKIGKKHKRHVIDEDYADLLIGKCIMFGAQLKPHYTGTEILCIGGVINVFSTRLMARGKDDEHWTVYTKHMHDFLTSIKEGER